MTTLLLNMALLVPGVDCLRRDSDNITGLSTVHESEKSVLTAEHLGASRRSRVLSFSPTEPQL